MREPLPLHVPDTLVSWEPGAEPVVSCLIDWRVEATGRTSPTLVAHRIREAYRALDERSPARLSLEEDATDIEIFLATEADPAALATRVFTQSRPRALVHVAAGCPGRNARARGRAPPAAAADRGDAGRGPHAGGRRGYELGAADPAGPERAARAARAASRGGDRAAFHRGRLGGAQLPAPHRCGGRALRSAACRGGSSTRCPLATCDTIVVLRVTRDCASAAGGTPAGAARARGQRRALRPPGLDPRDRERGVGARRRGRARAPRSGGERAAGACRRRARGIHALRCGDRGHAGRVDTLALDPEVVDGAAAETLVRDALRHRSRVLIARGHAALAAAGGLVASLR